MKHLLPFLFPVIWLCDVVCGQGPLAPPAAPAPTQKSLQQIEPRIDLQAVVPAPGVTSDATHQYIISQPGSYYLSDNLTMTKAVGIDITVANVTLDLNGFVIVSGTSIAQQGIEIAVTASGCEISNGKVDGSGLDGFAGVRCDFAPTVAVEGVLKNLSVIHCLNGIVLSGQWRVDGCRATGNSSYGIFSNNALTAVNCEANGNGSSSSGGGAGFSANGACIFTNCTANNNKGYAFYASSAVMENCSATGNSSGITIPSDLVASNCIITQTTGVGILCQRHMTLSNCRSTDNGGSGFVSSGNGTLSNCQAVNNGFNGFSCSGVAVMTNCTATGNKTAGFSLADSASLTACNATSNGQSGNLPGFQAGKLCNLTGCSSTSNYGHGFSVDQNGCLIGCTASQNGVIQGATTIGIGIDIADHTSVRNCSVTGNNADGIRATDDCVLTGNTVSGNCRGNLASTAGIHLTNTANDVEGNSVNGNPVDGIYAELNRNFIARNTARNNGLNYVIAAGNRVAQIVVPAANAAVINGANGGSTDGYTAVDPWANFSY